MGARRGVSLVAGVVALAFLAVGLPASAAWLPDVPGLPAGVDERPGSPGAPAGHRVATTAAAVTIGDFVWDDLDVDGRQDAGEPGIAGVTVQLWNSTKTSLLDSTTTDASGLYSLTGEQGGLYRVRVVLPTANDAFSPKDVVAPGDAADSDINPDGVNLGFTDLISIGDNVLSVATVDAGIDTYDPPISTNIGNFVWDDRNEDGRQDVGEPGIAGVTVQLWNTAKTQLLDTTTTDAGGLYSLTGEAGGSYRVRVVLPTANDAFSPKDQAGGSDSADSDINPDGDDAGFTDAFTIAANVVSITLYDAGIDTYDPPISTNIGNFVWDDRNEDGRQDVGEPGIAGVTVQLWNTAKTQLLDTTTTDAGGLYSLTGEAGGRYRVRVVLPTANDAFSPKDQAGGSDSADSDINPDGDDAGFTDAFTIAANVVSITLYDAGIDTYDPPISTNIGNFVWDDRNEDGRQDVGEPGIAGVTVQLWNTAKTQLLDTTTTDAGGLYSLTGEAGGSYRVRVVLPTANDAFSPKDQAGGSDSADSDINPDGDDAGFTDAFTIAANVVSITLYDAGIDTYDATPTQLRARRPDVLGDPERHQRQRQPAGDPVDVRHRLQHRQQDDHVLRRHQRRRHLHEWRERRNRHHKRHRSCRTRRLARTGHLRGQGGVRGGRRLPRLYRRVNSQRCHRKRCRERRRLVPDQQRHWPRKARERRLHDSLGQQDEQLPRPAPRHQQEQVAPQGHHHCVREDLDQPALRYCQRNSCAVRVGSNQRDLGAR